MMFANSRQHHVAQHSTVLVGRKAARHCLAAHSQNCAAVGNYAVVATFVADFAADFATDFAAGTHGPYGPASCIGSNHWGAVRGSKRNNVLMYVHLFHSGHIRALGGAVVVVVVKIVVVVVSVVPVVVVSVAQHAVVAGAGKSA